MPPEPSIVTEQQASTNSEASEPPPTPRDSIAILPNEIINRICDHVIQDLPRGVHEAIERVMSRSKDPHDISFPYVVDPAKPKTHPLMKANRLFRQAMVAKYYWTRTFTFIIGRPDPGCVVLDQYLASFEGALPYVRSIVIDVVVTFLDHQSNLKQGDMRITLMAGLLRVVAQDNVVEHNPDQLSDAELVRRIALPWTTLLMRRIGEQQDAIERVAGDKKDDWIGIREGVNSYQVRIG